MKSVLKLNNPLWKTAARRLILDRAVQQSGAELESRIKRKVLESRPAGRVYRRGAIKKKVAQRDLKFYRSNRRIFKRTFTSLVAEKTTVGYKFHRASKKGQPFASDSGALLSSIRSKRIGFMSAKVASSKRYAIYLDSKNGLNRPFFESTVTEFKREFKANIKRAIDEMK